MQPGADGAETGTQCVSASTRVEEQQGHKRGGDREREGEGEREGEKERESFCRRSKTHLFLFDV